MAPHPSLPLPRALRTWLVPLALCGAAALGPSPARADGAFPDSMSLHLPADRPHQIIAATNFGLLISNDDGATWRWVCEMVIGQLAQLYQLGPVPADTLYAVTSDGLSYSQDSACTWQIAGGSLSGIYIADAFPDPSDPMHVLALAQPQDADMGLYESTDGGKTFQGPRYTAAPGGAMTGVEVARTDPKVIVVTLYQGTPRQPALARSGDGGMTWKLYDLGAAVGPQEVRLLGIDPMDANLLYLRVLSTQGLDSLAISRDGGQTVQDPIQPVGGQMSAFLRRTDGSLLVATLAGSIFRSSDAGKTFSRQDGAAHLRGLGERVGVLYGLGDNFKDHFAVGKSADGGMTWQPLLLFDGICGMLQCAPVQSTCAAAWDALVQLFGIPPTVCGQQPMGADGGDGGTNHNGCSCVVGGRAPAAGGLGPGGLGLGALALLRTVRRRRGCPRAGGPARAPC